MRGMAALCLMLFWTGLRVSAQESTSPDSTAELSKASLITIQTDVDSAIVFVDSVRMGKTPLVIRDLEPGLHRLRVVHPDVTNWLTGSILDSVQIYPGEEKALRYAFGQRYLILSVPSGAEVFINDSLKGSTPFLFSFQSTDPVPSISLRKLGYDTTRVNLAEAKRGVETITLKKVWRPEPAGEQTEEMSDGEKHGTLRIYLTGAATVIAGAAAAYFKIQADDRNNQYLENPTPSLRSETRRLDTASALCLTASQVGFGLLAYFLLTE